jgi:predicted transcriptional regulator
MLLMADQNPKGRASDDPSSPAREDRRTESAVLALLLDEHPTRLTMDELTLVLHADPDRGDPGDAAQRAVRELVGAGLIHREGRFLTPTRAALYFLRLEVS